MLILYFSKTMLITAIKSSILEWEREVWLEDCSGLHLGTLWRVVWAVRNLSLAVIWVQLTSTGVKQQKSTTKAPRVPRQAHVWAWQQNGRQALHERWKEGSRVKWIEMTKLKKRWGKLQLKKWERYTASCCFWWFKKHVPKPINQGQQLYPQVSFPHV